MNPVDAAAEDERVRLLLATTKAALRTWETHEGWTTLGYGTREEWVDALGDLADLPVLTAVLEGRGRRQVPAQQQAARVSSPARSTVRAGGSLRRTEVRTFPKGGPR